MSGYGQSWNGHWREFLTLRGVKGFGVVDFGEDGKTTFEWNIPIKRWLTVEIRNNGGAWDEDNSRAATIPE